MQRVRDILSPALRCDLEYICMWMLKYYKYIYIYLCINMIYMYMIEIIYMCAYM